MSRIGLWIALVLGGVLQGCFSVEHRLPPNTYFGQMPKRAGEQAVSFKRRHMQNWVLAGFVPYSTVARFVPYDMGATPNLLTPSEGTERVEDVSIETVFTWTDTLVWVVPGFLYGYYVWAPRTIRVRGTEIRKEP